MQIVTKNPNHLNQITFFVYYTEIDDIYLLEIFIYDFKSKVVYFILSLRMQLENGWWFFFMFRVDTDILNMSFSIFSRISISFAVKY